MSQERRRGLMASLPQSCWLPTLVCCALSLMAGGAHGDSPTPASPRTAGGRITVTFWGLRSRSGYLRVSLYDRADGFPDGTPVARRDLPLQTPGAKTLSDSLTVTFEGLPSGAYAVCAFHDRNGSGRLIRNFLGIPQEDWGMSGNPRPRFRAPRFDQARVILGVQEEKTVSIMLHT